MKTYIKPRITDICLENDSTALMQVDQTAAMPISMAQRASGPDACGVLVNSAAGAANPFASIGGVGSAGKLSCVDGEGLIYPSSTEIGMATAQGFTVNQKGFNFEAAYNCATT